MSTDIYGIKNCDTMKKALAWLDSHHVSYVFHDYKKAGMDTAVLVEAMKQHGWEGVINRKGASWRALTDEVKLSMVESRAIELATKNPSLVRRPLLKRGQSIYLGFSESAYATLFGTP